MLKIASAGVAAISLFTTPLESISILPLKTAATEFVVLGIIPFTNIEITFNMLFVSTISIVLFFLFRKLYWSGRRIIRDSMWDQNYLDQISI